MRLKRFGGKVRRVVRKRADLLAEAEALRKEGTSAQGFRERLRALVEGAQRCWETLSPEEREGLLSQVMAFLTRLPAGRLGRLGLLVAKGAQLGAKKEVLSLLLKLLKR
ncbi:hypothetical protein [Thermus sp.]|uniref:hypothetical protein n=1 Tax=Thermus sp. TaxID=275 RepID=UPI003220465B